jgi:predicted ATPase
MSISEIRLRNFRGFKDTGEASATIELKPLTVLLGPNSAGKSSFGHALAAMGHAQSKFQGTANATLTPSGDAEDWPVDLGGYTDLRTTGTSGPVCVDFRSSEGWITLGFGGIKSIDSLLLSYLLYPVGPGDTRSEDFKIVTPDFIEGTTVTTDQEGGSAQTSLVKKNLLELSRKNERQWADAAGRETRVGLSGLLLDTVRHVTGTDIPLSNGPRIELSALLEQVTYLRANRRRPSRGYDKTKHTISRLGYAGELAAAVMNDKREDEVEFLMPSAFPSNLDDMKTIIDVGWTPRREPLSNAVSAWLQQFGLASSARAEIGDSDTSRLFLRFSLNSDWSSRDITEVGFGLSQILPVLVGGLLQPSDGVFIVDLPEAHLHPRPQAELADFFCSLALSGRRALVETHSEMFFHRLRLRAALNREFLDKIAVYFFDAPEKDGQCAQLRKIGLDYDGELKWPVGFLQEGWDAEAQINAVRRARSQK